MYPQKLSHIFPHRGFVFISHFIQFSSFYLCSVPEITLTFISLQTSFLDWLLRSSIHWSCWSRWQSPWCNHQCWDVQPHCSHNRLCQQKTLLGRRQLHNVCQHWRHKKTQRYFSFMFCPQHCITKKELNFCFCLRYLRCCCCCLFWIVLEHIALLIV